MEEKIKEQIDELVGSREKFNAFVYTPLEKVLEEFQKRQNNEILKKYIEESLPAGLPEFLTRDEKYVILCRHLATPNYELKNFLSAVDQLGGVFPMVPEYFHDKFLTENEFKYRLARLAFSPDRPKERQTPVERLNVIDFNAANGEPISSIRTLWDQSFVDFHHDLLDQAFLGQFKKYRSGKLFFDMSEWLSKSGGDARGYYKNFLRLLLRNCIIFEDFMLDQEEIGFTREIFLKNLIEISNETGGIKPLIVFFDPTETEEDHSWVYYDSKLIGFVKEKLKEYSVDKVIETASSFVRPLMIETKPSKAIPGEIGLFAARGLPKDFVIAEASKFGERLIPWSEFDKIDAITQAKVLQFCLPCEEGFFAPEDLNYLSTSWSMNHSCSYNVGFDDVGNFITAREIKKGEELFLDYGMSGSGPRFKLQCRCGSKNCRGLITGDDWKNKEFVRKNKKYFLRELLQKADLEIKN